MTYHVQTDHDIETDLKLVSDLLVILERLKDYIVVATYSNFDRGGDKINNLLIANKKIKVVPSLGSRRYLSFMKETAFVIGNSWSGIVEAPYLRIPVVNIGDRQKGRHMCDNVICCDGSIEAMTDAIDRALKLDTSNMDCSYYGDGHTSNRIIKILSKILA